MVEKLCIQKASLNLLSAIEQPLSTKAYISLLKDCCQAKSLHQAKQIKTHLTNNHVPLSGLLGDYLVVTLARCGDPEEALLTSYKLPFRTVFSWTAIISSYSDDSLGLDALRIYRLMQQDGIQPDRYTFVALLKSCGIASDLLQGMDLHSDAICRAFTLDVFVVSSLCMVSAMRSLKLRMCFSDARIIYAMLFVGMLCFQLTLRQGMLKKLFSCL